MVSIRERMLVENDCFVTDPGQMLIHNNICRVERSYFHLEGAVITNKYKFTVERCIPRFGNFVRNCISCSVFVTHHRF